MVTMLIAVLALFSLVAETCTRVLDLTTGAMNNPPLVMVPELAAQTTADLFVLLTVVANCCLEPEARTRVLGEIVSCACVDCTGAPLVERPPQPTEISAAR